jgi:hypothetical protein
MRFFQSDGDKAGVALQTVNDEMGRRDCLRLRLCDVQPAVGQSSNWPSNANLYLFSKYWCTHSAVVLHARRFQQLFNTLS